MAASASTREVQQLLTSLTFPVGAIDGVVGPKTRRDTARFQLGYNLGEPLTVDGVAGPLTTAALRHSVNDRGGRCSENFWYREFSSNGNGGIMITRRQVLALESLRTAQGRPLSTTSDYRDPEYNERINGASRSMHLFGVGNDLPRSFEAELQVVRDLEVFSGVGWKRIDGKQIVLHVDTRGSGQVYVDESGRVQDVPVTTQGTPGNPTVWEYAPDVVVWEQEDLPDPGDFGDAIRRVVLVAGDDGLNVRLAAGVDSEILGMLAPDTVIGRNGPQTEIDSSIWVEMASPVGPGWVDSYFLAEVVTDDAFIADDRVIAMLDQVAEITRARGDLSTVASKRGIAVSHHAAPTWFRPDQLRAALTDPTTFSWPSNAIDDGDLIAPSDDGGRTFAEAVADSFASTWDDPDRMFAHNQPLAGRNGRRPGTAIPDELRGFHYVSVVDSGDDPASGGLDWTSWCVAFDYEDNVPVVVGLTLDQWAP